MSTIIIGLMVIAAAVYFFGVRKYLNQHKSNDSIQNSDSVHGRSFETDENMYEEFRDRALSTTPEFLGLQVGPDEVYGVVMDWGMREGTASTVSFLTGDASLYLSSGGAVIGGGQHESVSGAAIAFVRSAQDFLPEANLTSTTPAAGPDELRFYLLTSKGKYVGTEQMENIDNETSPWLPLFVSGNHVLTELRKISESQRA